MSKADTYKSAQLINRQVRFMGLDGIQLLLLFAVIVITFIISRILPVIIIIIVSIILGKINREIKRGNPSPIKSYFLKSKQKNLIDDTNVLNKLSNLEHENN